MKKKSVQKFNFLKKNNKTEQKSLKQKFVLLLIILNQKARLSTEWSCQIWSR